MSSHSHSKCRVFSLYTYALKYKSFLPRKMERVVALMGCVCYGLMVE